MNRFQLRRLASSARESLPHSAGKPMQFEAVLHAMLIGSTVMLLTHTGAVSYQQQNLSLLASHSAVCCTPGVCCSCHHQAMYTLQECSVCSSPRRMHEQTDRPTAAVCA